MASKDSLALWKNHAFIYDTLLPQIIDSLDAGRHYLPGRRLSYLPNLTTDSSGMCGLADSRLQNTAAQLPALQENTACNLIRCHTLFRFL